MFLSVEYRQHSSNKNKQKKVHVNRAWAVRACCWNGRLAVTRHLISSNGSAFYFFKTMKKNFFCLVLFLISSIDLFAQQWERTVFEADELKGRKEGYIAYDYTDPNVGSFICWSNKPNQYRIINKNGIFNYSVNGQYRGLTVVVGIYDENEKLLDKFSMWLDCENDKPTFLETRDAVLFNPPGQKKKVKKMMDCLTSGKGYVRIIADTYGTSPDFDLKIPSTLVLK